MLSEDELALLEAIRVSGSLTRAAAVLGKRMGAGAGLDSTIVARLLVQNY